MTSEKHVKLHLFDCPQGLDNNQFGLGQPHAVGIGPKMSVYIYRPDREVYARRKDLDKVLPLCAAVRLTEMEKMAPGAFVQTDAVRNAIYAGKKSMPVSDHA